MNNNSTDNREKRLLLKDIRQAFADYMATEGCSCCQDEVGHQKALNTLGRLLKMKRHSDGSGFDYGKYKSKS